MSWILHDLLIFWFPGTCMNDLVRLTYDFHYASDTDWIRIQLGLASNPDWKSRLDPDSMSTVHDNPWLPGQYRVGKKYWYRNHVGYEGDMYLVLGGYVQLYRTYCNSCTNFLTVVVIAIRIFYCPILRNLIDGWGLGSVRYRTVEEGNFEHLFNFEAHLKICQIFFHYFFLA